MSSIYFDAEYLVLLKEVIVSEDVAQALVAYNPRARVHQMRSWTDALQQVRASSVLRAVFLDVRGLDRAVEDPVLSDLLGEVKARGARVVLVGAENIDEGTSVGLPTPFNDDVLSALLARLEGEAGIAQRP